MYAVSLWALALPVLGNQLEIPVPLINWQDDDHDSTYEDDSSASYTTSLASSVRAYRNENGRRYHAYKDGSTTLLA